MTDQVTIARRLYDAMAARDPHAILDAMQEDFVGQVSEGMPLAVGGRHEGREEMVRDVWARIFGAYEMDVDVERYLPAGDDEVVALGHYRGSERATGRRFEAGFAHVLTVRDGRIASLHQITDTRVWVGDAAS